MITETPKALYTHNLFANSTGSKSPTEKSKDPTKDIKKIVSEHLNLASKIAKKLDEEKSSLTGKVATKDMKPPQSTTISLTHLLKKLKPQTSD